MLHSALRFLSALALVAAVFSASYLAAGKPRRVPVEKLLVTVAQDSATVCSAAGPCLDRGADYTLLVFFSPGDCPPCLYDTVVLEDLYTETSRERLNVIGIAYGLTVAEARKFAAASGITYPLNTAPAVLERHVRNPRPQGSVRPVKVLLDGEGRTVGSWGSRLTVAAHAEDKEEILALVGR